MKIPRAITRSVRDKFVVIDSTFPQKKPFAFRNTEINEYLKRIRDSSVYTMYPMQPGPDAWFRHGYGMSPTQFKDNKDGYARHYPKNSHRIHLLSEKKRYRFKLAYSFFLAETYVLLPFFEKNKVPFIFVLYPGGAFGLNNEGSDGMLKKLFSSRYFRGVITTQDITKNYLISKELCPKEKICAIYGGFVQFKQHEVLERSYYGRDKDTLDICFVAAKYSKKGVDKGYDVFIEVAKRVVASCDSVRFHVVGGFSETDIDVGDIEERITFYGYRDKEFLLSFYKDMDIFLSPGRAGMLYEGNFDGFPLGIDAAFCGSAMLVTDPLKLNEGKYVDNEEIVIIDVNVENIAEKIGYFFRNPEDLIRVARKGQARTQDLFDIDKQISKRIEFFRSLTNLEIDI